MCLPTSFIPPLILFISSFSPLYLLLCSNPFPSVVFAVMLWPAAHICCLSSPPRRGSRIGCNKLYLCSVPPVSAGSLFCSPRVPHCVLNAFTSHRCEESTVGVRPYVHVCSCGLYICVGVCWRAWACMMIFMTESISVNFIAMLWQLVTGLDMSVALQHLQRNIDLYICLLIQPGDTTSASTGTQKCMLFICLFTLNRLYLQNSVCSCACVLVFKKDSRLYLKSMSILKMNKSLRLNLY